MVFKYFGQNILGNDEGELYREDFTDTPPAGTKCDLCAALGIDPDDIPLATRETYFRVKEWVGRADWNRPVAICDECYEYAFSDRP